ncbi:hypothetical protein AGMMS50212_11730 [Spirochaetia bacterium]|nr:hypothetical protein AGMMS50212_11730 [Spirochaetia bacterium]
MKIVVIYDKESAKQAETLCNSFKKVKVSSGEFDAEMLEVSGLLSGNGGALETLKNSTHIAAFFSAVPDCADFLAGFAAGRGIKIAYFSPNNLTPPELLKDNSVIFDKGKAVSDFFKKEIEDFTGKEAREQAKKSIMAKGIPLGIESFAQIVSEGTVEIAALFIQSGFHANDYNKNGVPMLCLAARAGNLDMIKFLIKENAGVNSISRDRGNSAIIDASLGKYSDIISYLIKVGANLNIKNKDGQSALIIAVGLNDIESIRLLLKAGANPDEPDSLGASARKYAVLLKKNDILALLEKLTPQS